MVFRGSESVRHAFHTVHNGASEIVRRVDSKNISEKVKIFKKQFFS